MGAEGFRRAPMMHEKLTTLGRTRFNPEHSRCIEQIKKQRILLLQHKLVIVSSANYYIGAATTSRILFARKVIKLTKSNFFFFGFSFAWLIGPGIFRGNCPLGNFKGRYAGRIGRQF